MDNKKIAILVDSGADVPPDFVKEHNIFVAPLKIIYKDQEYDDRVEITPEEIYARLKTEVPRTSLPASGNVLTLFKRMVTEGYDTVLIITISSGLSGTHNQLRVQAEEFGKLKFHILGRLVHFFGFRCAVFDDILKLLQPLVKRLALFGQGRLSSNKISKRPGRLYTVLLHL